MEQFRQFKVFFTLNLMLAYFIANVSAVSSADDLEITLEERTKLEMFRKVMSSRLYMDYMKEDCYLLRWLRARGFDLKRAENLLETNLRWRKDNKIDGIHEEDWDDIIKDYPYSIDGFDKEGRPVGTVSIRDWDIRRAALQGKLPRLQRYTDKLMDEITMKVALVNSQQGKNITRWILVTNVDGFNLIQHACPSSPDTFNIVLRLLQPSIPSSSREAVKILGTNKSVWMAYLDKIIGPDQRTNEYGGTKAFEGLIHL